MQKKKVRRKQIEINQSNSIAQQLNMLTDLLKHLILEYLSHGRIFVLWLISTLLRCKEVYFYTQSHCRILCDLGTTIAFFFFFYECSNFSANINILMSSSSIPLFPIFNTALIKPYAISFMTYGCGILTCFSTFHLIPPLAL